MQAIAKRFPPRFDEYETSADPQSHLAAPDAGGRIHRARRRHRLRPLLARHLQAVPASIGISVRAKQPYSSYGEKFGFQGVSTPDRNAMGYGRRYLKGTHRGEMRQSLRIVNQAMEGLPEVPVKVDAPHIVMPERESMKTSIEALIYHFKIVTEGFHPPIGEVCHYGAIESPRGELGFYMVSDGSPKPFPLPRSGRLLFAGI